MRLPRAYTPNAVCSPARASLMTGLLPHSHGVLEVTHTVDDDQSCLRTEFPHWAQRLEQAGYRTGYFGKWHVERSGELTRFGWQVTGTPQAGHKQDGRFSLQKWDEHPEGYRKTLLYGVTDVPPERRGVGLTTDLGLAFLEEAANGEQPWCCFVSITEPHDPFVTGHEAFAQYDVDSLPLQPNVGNDLSGQPNLYRKAGVAWRGHGRTPEEGGRRLLLRLHHRDRHSVRAPPRLPRILGAARRHDRRPHQRPRRAARLPRPLLQELHRLRGGLLDPHGGGGSGGAAGVTSQARVGLHDLCPTLLELAGLETIGAPDSRSFAGALQDPAGGAGDFTRGFAEYHGSRYRVSQRIVWDGPWKLCWNGFDFDELYNLDDDPYEMTNLIDVEGHEEVVRSLMRYAWQVVRDTGDETLLNSHYPILRLGRYGPGILGE